MYLLHKAEVYLQCSYHSQCRIKLLSSLPIKEHSHNSKPKQCSRVKKKNWHMFHTQFKPIQNFRLFLYFIHTFMENIWIISKRKFWIKSLKSWNSSLNICHNRKLKIKLISTNNITLKDNLKINPNFWVRLKNISHF